MRKIRQQSHFMNGILGIVWVVLCVSIASPVTAVVLPFGDSVGLTSGWDTAREIVAGDFDGDGLQDLMAVAEGAGQVWLWRNNGDGSFSRSTVAGGLDAPWRIDIGDIDCDGDLDAVVGQDSTSVSGTGVGELMWFANPAIGVNSSWTAYVVADFPNSKVQDLQVADIDRDGILDIVVARGINDPGLIWMENGGSPTVGTWSEHTVGSFASFVGMTVADIDSDGDFDVVSEYGGELSWWENNGVPDDNWTRHGVADNLHAIWGIACGDVTGNGETDIVITEPDGNSISLYEQSGSSWTLRDLTPPAANDPWSVRLQDLDLDGDLDIIASILYSNEVLWLENGGGAGATWTIRIIDGSFSGADCAVAADLDGDGDFDIASTGLSGNVAHWENRLIHIGMEFDDPAVIRTDLGEPRGVELGDVNGDGIRDLVIAEWSDNKITAYYGMNDSGSLWWEQTAVDSFPNVRDVALADMDLDGDLDIVGAAVGSDQVWWWANGGSGFPPSWTSHIVLNSFNGAHMATPVDLDCDGDMDVAVAAFDGDEIAWVQNNNGVGSDWTKYTITTADGAHDLVAGDLDGDGIPDLAYSAYYGDSIGVAINPTGSADFWGLYTVASGVDGPRGLALGDIDGDGDLDIVAALRLENHIRWFENDGTGINWTSHALYTGALNDGAAVAVADIDHDGDADVVATSQADGDIFVWENNGNGSSWTKRQPESSLASPWALAVGDVEGDGGVDIVAAAGGTADTLQWYRQVGGQTTVSGWDTAPSTIYGGVETELLKFSVGNNGRTGFDGSEQPTTVTLLFSYDSGSPMSQVDAQAFFDRLRVYGDDDGDDVLSAGDVMLANTSSFNLVDGKLSVALADSAADQQIGPGNQWKLYFITLTASEAAASRASLSQFILSYLPEESQSEDAAFAIPVTATPADTVATDVIKIRRSEIFSDGFESSDTSAWSGP